MSREKQGGGFISNTPKPPLLRGEGRLRRGDSLTQPPPVHFVHHLPKGRQGVRLTGVNYKKIPPQGEA